MVSRLFGKKKQEKPKEEQAMDAIQNLQKTIKDLDNRQNLIQLKAQAALEEAKEHNKKKNKNQAVFALKKKKMYDNEIAKIDGEKMTLETQLFSIENASTHTNVFNSVKGANQVINKLNEGINVEEIDKLQADMEEQQALQDEIAEALSQPVGFMANQDEDELLQELDAMEAEEFEQQAMEKLGEPGVPANL